MRRKMNIQIQKPGQKISAKSNPFLAQGDTTIQKDEMG
jgi:hypothetical protein